MSADDCREIDVLTRRPEYSRKRCAMFNEACPGCSCEAHRIGWNSPGPVASTECVTRFHFSPLDLDPTNGTPLPAAFSDVEHLGLSITREHASDEVITAAISERLNRLPADREWHSVSIASVAAIRAIVSLDREARQAFGVYDTSEPGNAEHAEVMQTTGKRQVRIELRKKFLAMNRQQYRGGRLRPIRTTESGLPQE